jgi:hypothetical protein
MAEQIVYRTDQNYTDDYYLAIAKTLFSQGRITLRWYGNDYTGSVLFADPDDTVQLFWVGVHRYGLFYAQIGDERAGDHLVQEFYRDLPDKDRRALAILINKVSVHYGRLRAEPTIALGKAEDAAETDDGLPRLRLEYVE